MVGKELSTQVPVKSALLPVSSVPLSHLEHLGRRAAGTIEQATALLGFVGEIALAFTGCLVHPVRFRWRPMWSNLRSAGFDALPIVGLLSFLLGIVVAYQGADQLRPYGANIFIADLVGRSMLREFAPLMTAIIVAAATEDPYGGVASANRAVQSVLEQLAGFCTTVVVQSQTGSAEAAKQVVEHPHSPPSHGS
jgi:phospholipid/cholesterol/gamma-HCH transport system permease protein